MLDAAPWWCHAAISNKVTAAPLVGRFVDKDKAVPGLGADQGQGWVRPLTLSQVYVSVQLSQFSRSVVSDSLQPHESQHSRPPCPLPSPRVHSDSRPSSQ